MKKANIKANSFMAKKKNFQIKKLWKSLNLKIKDKNGLVTEKTVEIKKENPPSLFNLSNLQGYITSKYKGFTADKVLKVSQSLYEKKYITYPRTESTALEESIKDKAKKY